MNQRLICILAALTVFLVPLPGSASGPDRTRLRLIIETDAGGDPDDEQSMVRFLLCANEWDVEGIICNRPHARDGENRNPERTGLGIVRRQLNAYGACYLNLVRHDRRYPTKEYLWQRTVAGYADTDAGVQLILAAVNSPDPRPVWYADWGSDRGSAPVNMKRALDLVYRKQGPTAYAKFKDRLRLVSYDQYGDHTTKLAPPLKLWVNTFQPPLEKKRWYHRFSPLTAKAGGFDLRRDVLTSHGPLGAMYPTNTTLPQKEGDTMTFLYLLPTGMNDPEQPTWGSWAGRYGLNPAFPGRPYYWANQADTWHGTTHRDNSLKRWAVDLQNDFRARLDWCVKPVAQANHPPAVVVNGQGGLAVLHLTAKPGEEVRFNAAGTTDPDGQELSYEWSIYPEAGTYRGAVTIADATKPAAHLRVPADAGGKTIHVLLTVRDRGAPPLARYRRVVVTCSQRPAACGLGPAKPQAAAELMAPV